jgi:hypothetical protein
MLADMPRNHPGISVKTSPGGEADYETNGLAFVKLSGSQIIGKTREKNKPNYCCCN